MALQKKQDEEQKRLKVVADKKAAKELEARLKREEEEKIVQAKLKQKTDLINLKERIFTEGLTYKTKSGQSIKITQVKIVDVYPDAIKFRHSDGLGRILFKRLPQEFRTLYQYDEKAAKEFYLKRRAEEKKVAAKRSASLKKKLEKNKELARKKVQDDEALAAKAAEVKQKNKAASNRKNLAIVDKKYKKRLEKMERVAKAYYNRTTVSRTHQRTYEIKRSKLNEEWQRARKKYL